MSEQHDIWLKVGAYTGLHLWWYLLSDASQAVRIARKAKVNLVVVPSGSAWKIVDGGAHRIQRPDLGPF